MSSNREGLLSEAESMPLLPIHYGVRQVILGRSIDNDEGPDQGFEDYEATGRQIVLTVCACNEALCLPVGHEKLGTP